MKIWVIRILLIINLCGSYLSILSQDRTDFKQLQGIWKLVDVGTEEGYNEDEYKYYLYHEGHNQYDIYQYKSGEISIAKMYLVLSEMTNDDNPVPIESLGIDGQMYTVIFDTDIDFEKLEKYGPDSVTIRLSNVLQQSYELGGATWTLINNSGFNFFNKIERLPPDIYKEFLLQKEKLDKEIIFDFVPDYLREGPDPLPYQVEVINERVYFHTLPEESTRQKTFIISGNRAKVLYKKGNWYYVIFYGTSRNTPGWVKVDQVRAIYEE